jgi:Mitochondrial carrier protein/Cyclic nucleotide-binding domain/EF-hand domain pair
MADNDTALPAPPPLEPVAEGENAALPKLRRKFSEKNEKDQELIRLALHKSPFFTCLDEEQVERFIQAAELKFYSAGQAVIIEGCVDDFEGDQAHDQTVSLSQRSNPQGGDREGNGSDAAPRGGDHESQSRRQMVNETGESVTEDSFVLVERENENVQGHDPQDSSNVAQFTTSGPAKEADSIPVDSSSDQDTAQDSLVATSLVTTTAQAGVIQFSEDTTSQHYLEPPPPRSGTPSYIYIVRSGQADVMYSNNVNPASLGTGTVFGEGGFLFGRQHSASIMAASDENLECYVVDAATFRNYILPSDNMTKLYQKYAIHVDEETNSRYMTMQDFIDSCLEPLKGRQHPGDSTDVSDTPIQDPLEGIGIANTFNLLRNGQVRGAAKFSQQRISLSDFCIFHLLMARPDPEVDITFLLMDERKRGVIYKDDIASFVKSSLDNDFMFDMNSEFIHRHFGKGMTSKDTRQQHQRGIRPHQFSQFLVDLRREIGQQIFLQEVEKNGTPEGYLPPTNFVRVLKKACGWRLPEGVAVRLDSIYRSDPVSVSEADTDHRYDGATHSRRLGDRHFSYCDFLAFQEVLGQLSGICNLIDRAEQIKKSPLSTDDFKVANRVLGMGGRLSRRQVDIIFQLFDLNDDGFVSHEDTVAVAGAEIAQRIDAVAGRQGALTFAPPPEYRHDVDKQEMGKDVFLLLLQNFSLTSIAGCIGVFALAPLDLVKTRLMNERVPLNGSRMYRNSFDCLKIAVVSEGYFGLYRGLLPQLIGVAPEKALKLAVNDLLNHSMGVSDPGQPKTAIHFLQEMLAGGGAGACQLLVTNPVSQDQAVA